ncbi:MULTISPECIES: cytochrome b [unclassified Salinivibrio]|uniref:cytochrome b n=1 Tax=unclassified Salinivibrio TaxID=2636825 RepID=UPI00084CA333|nr:MULTISPECIES: cytochrome b [unclassified Salinivibrio]ODQ00067.1 cytochrome b [Salinivibrio sp. DV]OOF09113.1 cytochrome b [Salinivibrio sp. PR919]OOF16742.1 cytochrome b [Salinivibrio sp. PR932]PCE65127.1 cytochrome b [Salinivibrio sp. YCSC6]QCF37826.1 cytochrome b [Salinivibrio sp. YCSC6]
MTAKTSYDPVMRVLHWLSTLVIIGLFAVGLWMVDLSYYSSWYQTAPHWHKSIGILLAGATILRLGWKITHTMPKVEGKAWERKAATAAHHTIYLLLAVLFVSGYLISTSDGRGIDVFTWFTVPSAGELFPNQSDIAGDVHYYVAITLIALAAVHALAALKHHFIDKDNTLRKMIGGNPK